MRPKNFVEQVRAVIEQTVANPLASNRAPRESTLGSNVEDGIAKMRKLKRIGNRLCLDEFAETAIHKSLALHKRLAAHQLKIDQAASS